MSVHEKSGTARSPRVLPDFQGVNVLVTGGFGFIGSHLTAHLVDLGAEVTVLDLSVDLARESLINRRPHLRRALTVVPGSLDDPRLVSSVIRNQSFDVVFHCASYASTVERALQFPRETLQTNTIGLVNLLEAIRVAQHRPRAIVHTSTDKVYGDSQGKPYDEYTTPLQATGVYDVSKLAADAFARMYHEAYGLPTVVARLCNIFGPFDFNTQARLVPRAMKALFGNDRPSPPELYQDSSKHARDYLYVEDCVDALIALASTPACVGQVYNLPGCRHLGTPQMLQAIVKASAAIEREDDPARADAIEANGYTTVPAQDIRGLITIPTQTCDGHRLHSATGFSPRVSLEDGLKATCLGYRDVYRPRSLAPLTVAGKRLTVHSAHTPRPMRPKSGKTVPERGAKS